MAEVSVTGKVSVVSTQEESHGLSSLPKLVKTARNLAEVSVGTWRHGAGIQNKTLYTSESHVKLSDMSRAKVLFSD